MCNVLCDLCELMKKLDMNLCAADSLYLHSLFEPASKNVFYWFWMSNSAFTLQKVLLILCIFVWFSSTSI